MVDRIARELRGMAALKLLIIGLLLTVGIGLAACGGDDGQPEQDAQSQATQRAEREQDGEAEQQEVTRQERQATIQQEQQQQAGAAQAEAGDAAPVAPRERGEFRIARAEPINLDPAQITDVSSAVIAVEIFGGLLVLDRDLRIAPDLAESVPSPTLNDDGTVTYRFTIRRNATFHDGKPIRAQDFKWTLERNLHPETLSPTAPDFLGDIVGAAEYVRERVDEVVGIQVVDEYTLDITILQATPVFLYKLTYPTAYVLDRDQVEADPERWALNPNGSGPFRLTEWQLGEGLTLERFDDYHLEPAQVAKVSVRFAGGSVEQFENDELDQAFVGINDIERVRDPANELNSQYVTRSELSIFYLAFNVSTPPFDDVNVRLALAHAIDKTTITQEVQADLLIQARQIVPPGLAAHDADYPGLVFDPELAQEYLAASRYAGTATLEDIRLTISGAGATPGPSIEAIQDMWRQHLASRSTSSRSSSPASSPTSTAACTDSSRWAGASTIPIRTTCWTTSSTAPRWATMSSWTTRRSTRCSKRLVTRSTRRCGRASTGRSTTCWSSRRSGFRCTTRWLTSWSSRTCRTTNRREW